MWRGINRVIKLIRCFIIGRERLEVKGLKEFTTHSSLLPSANSPADAGSVNRLLFQQIFNILDIVEGVVDKEGQLGHYAQLVFHPLTQLVTNLLSVGSNQC